MNTESLRNAETPIHPTYPEDEGVAEVFIDHLIDADAGTLAAAVVDAKAWGEGSGFKVGPVKFVYGNVVEMKLRRP